MDMFIKAIEYCKNGLKNAIENNDDNSIIKEWRQELDKWNYEFHKYYNTCKNPMIINK